ncbi:MAG TPA: YihY/virulence factor BrkB family protein [Bryobacteraceae bacterium]|nr:YihY/virulence factor BrkB family protein [Bryobacteraceae bacterium]
MRYLKQTISDFVDDNGQTQAAALAYFSLFALPPLLLLVISIAGLAFGREAAQGKVQAQIQGLIGSGAASQISTMVAKAGQHSSTGAVATGLGLLALIFGATSAFSQLQQSLNTIWRVKPDPKASGIKNFVVGRIFSFGMVVAIGFLLLVSLVIDTILTGFGGMIKGWLPAGFSEALLHGITFLVSFIVISIMFAAIFKVLPDAAIEWRQVSVGAIATAALFTVGKFLIGFYLGRSGTASMYGAAGSLVLIVLWLYYSSIIVLVGAEFTRVWSESHGKVIEPKKGAVRVDLAA